MKVLQVLTLLDHDGQYGGPVKVAREISKGLRSRNVSINILGGSLSYSAVISGGGEESFYGRSLLKKHGISTFWSKNLTFKIFSEIRKSDFVHIHFARDIISYVTAFICLLYSKPYLTQTHGMIVKDKRPLVLAIDMLITKPILNRASKVLLLSKKEEREFIKLKSNNRMFILPNGIEVPSNIKFYKKEKLILFCGRIHLQKRVDRFVKIAEQLQKPEWIFEIIGPDSGYLKELLVEIGNTSHHTRVQYLGAFLNSELQLKMSKSALLILPSYNEQFPMVVLEALSHGTPVVVAPSCGIADQLRKFDPNFVANSDELSDFISRVNYWMNNLPSLAVQKKISKFCKVNFGIEKVCGSLLNIYKSEFNL